MIGCCERRTRSSTSSINVNSPQCRSSSRISRGCRSASTCSNVRTAQKIPSRSEGVSEAPMAPATRVATSSASGCGSAARRSFSPPRPVSRRRDACRISDHLRQRPERDAVAVGQASSAQHLRVHAEHIGPLVCEPGLAMPAYPSAVPARTSRFEPFVQRLPPAQLTLTAHHRSAQIAHCSRQRVGHLKEPVSVYRAHLAARTFSGATGSE